MTNEKENLIQIESRIQEEYFVKFYDSVLFDTRLSSNDKVLLCFYIKVGGNRNYSWYGVKKIGKLLNLNEKTIRTCNRALREYGYIETVLKTVNTPYKIIVNPIRQVNGFDIIREAGDSKIHNENISVNKSKETEKFTVPTEMFINSAGKITDSEVKITTPSGKNYSYKREDLPLKNTNRIRLCEDGGLQTERDDGKIYRDDEGKNSPCGKNYRASAVKITAPERENLPQKNNNITRLNELEHTHTSHDEKKENFTVNETDFEVCFFQKCLDLTKLPVSELSQIPYFKSHEKRDEVALWESMIVEAGLNYKRLIHDAGESVKNSSPANRFLNFISTFRIMVWETYEKVIKANRVAELKAKARAEENARWQKEHEEQEAREIAEAKALGITRAELEEKKWQENIKEWDEFMGGVKGRLKAHIDKKNKELEDYRNSIKTNESGMPIFKAKELNDNVKHYLTLENNRVKITKEEVEKLLKRAGLK